MGRIRTIHTHKASALQGRLDLAPVAALTFTAEHSLERAVLRTLIAALVVCACLYLYLVTASVLHVMARREALAQIDSVQSTISSLEQRYFALSQGLTPKEGASLGLAPVDSTSYVYRADSLGAATIASNAI